MDKQIVNEEATPTPVAAGSAGDADDVAPLSPADAPVSVESAAAAADDVDDLVSQSKEQYGDMLRMILARQAKIDRALEEDEAQLHERQDRMDASTAAADGAFYGAASAAAYRPDLASGAAPESSYPPPSTSTWQGLSDAVASRGLPPLDFSAPGAGASGESVLRLVRELTAQLDKAVFERSRAVESAAFSSNYGGGGAMLDISSASLDASFAEEDDVAIAVADDDDPIFFNGPQLRRRVREATLANKKLRNRGELHKAEASREAAARVKVAKRCRKLEETLHKMRQLLRHAKNRANAKEAELTRLRNHLSSQVRTQQQQSAKMSKTIEGSGAGGKDKGVKGAAAAFAQQRDKMEREIAFVRSENARLLATLREHENRAELRAPSGGPAAEARASPGGAEGGAGVDAGGEGGSRLAARRRARMQTLMDDLGRLETRLAESTMKAKRLAEDNATLRTEMRERPSVLELSAAQRAIRGLEEELARRIASPPRGALAARPVPQKSRALPSAAPPLGAVRRAKQPLTARLSPAAARSLLGAMCKTLRKSDPAQLPATVAKLLRAAASLPRLQSFARDVCAVVSAERASEKNRGECFILFTVTLCANPANDLTCPPSYIII